MGKRLIPYLFFGTIIIVVIFYVSLLLDFNILGVAVLFVIPFGGGIIAYVIGYFSHAAMMKDNISCGIPLVIFIGAWACLTVFGLTYFDYATCFVDAGNSVNHLFHGDHISNYQTNDGLVLDYSNYIKTFYLQGTMQIIVRFRVNNPLDTGITGFGLFLYIAQYAVAGLGSMLYAYSVNREARCYSCNKYYKTREVDTFADTDSLENFLTLLSESDIEGKFYEPVHETSDDGCIPVKAKFCPDCKTGELWIFRRPKDGSADDDIKIGDMRMASEQLRFLRLISDYEIDGTRTPEINKRKKLADGKYSNDQAEPCIVSETGRARYDIEHSILKNAFFDDPGQTISMVLQDNGVFEIYRQIFESMRIAYPYMKCNFNVETMKPEQGGMLVLIELPPPEYVPLCYRIYLLINKDFTKIAYFTVERGVTEGFLCRWEGDQHINYRKIQNPEWVENVGSMRSIESQIIIDYFYS